MAASGYFFIAALTIVLTSDGRNHATVWPADALILALLLTSRRPGWKTILLCGWIGNLIANLVTRGASPGLVFYGAINMGQALFAAMLITRHLPGRRDFLGSMLANGQFLLYAGLVAPAVGAIAGSIVSLINYGEPFGESFVRWYAGNAIGLLIGTPVLLSIADGSYLRCFRSKTGAERIEALGFLALHTTVTIGVFAQTRFPLLFLPMSSLLILAFRLGRLGTFAGVAITACAGATAAYLGLGPMALMHDGPVLQSVYFQFYIAVITCTALPVATTVALRGEALEKLADHRRALQQILTHVPEGILSFDEDGICSLADGRLEEFTGLEPAAFVGRSVEEIAAQTHFCLAPLVRDATANQEVPAPCDFSAMLKPERTLEASVGIVAKGNRKAGIVVTLRDITARKAREMAISVMAETDDLTGVYNRKGFGVRMSHALECATGPVTLALLDVDHFKSINDTFGHAVGDRVLQTLAQRLKSGTRATDSVSRLGGDEFAIVFSCDVKTATLACERIAEDLRRDGALEDMGVHASISCGVAQLHSGMTRGDLFDAADAALYAAKHAGRDGVRVAA